MVIHGIPDGDLTRLHWNCGHGKGALGFKHLPSGIEVVRECAAGVSVFHVETELLAELTAKLKSAAIIVSEASVSCCKSAFGDSPVVAANEPFAQMIVLDYYDGPASGFLKCKDCGQEYHFYMLDWDEAHIVRVFALAPVPPGSFLRLAKVFEATPNRPVWVPPAFRNASEETLAKLYDSGIQDVIDAADSPTLVIAWSIRAEKTLAMRAVDPSLADQLGPWFDRESYTDLYDWFGYLQLAKAPLTGARH